MLAFVAAAASLLLVRREWPKIALGAIRIAIGFAGSLGFRAIHVVERWAAPIRWHRAERHPSALDRWLARGRTPIAEVPFDVFASE